MAKLELGPGKDPTPGFDYYVDVYPADSVTHVLDFSKEGLSPFEDDSLDEILAIHFLEHLPQGRQKFFFNECKRKLKKGGKLEVHVPNLETIFRAYECFKDRSDYDGLMTELQSMMFGVHNGDAYSVHKIAYNWQILEKMFHDHEYRNVRNLTGIIKDRHTVGWQWVVDRIRATGGVSPEFSLIVEGYK